MRNISLSLLLILGISQSAQAMQGPLGNCVPTLGQMAYAFVAVHPVASAVIAVTSIAGYSLLKSPTPQVKEQK